MGLCEANIRLNLFFIPQLFFTNIHKHIQFNTLTYKQKGKRGTKLANTVINMTSINAGISVFSKRQIV